MEADFTQRWRERRAVFLQKQIFFNSGLRKVHLKISAGFGVV
jgi:hypothetical protein